MTEGWRVEAQLVEQPDAEVAETAAAVLLEYVVHPARERPRTTILTLCYVALATVALQAWLQTPWMTVAGALALLAAGAEFLLPSTCRLTAEGAERRCWAGGRRIAWSAVRAAYLHDDGVKLSPLEQPGWLDAYRGVFLPWDGHRDAILAIVDQYATARRRAVNGEDDGRPADA